MKHAGADRTGWIFGAPAFGTVAVLVWAECRPIAAPAVLRMPVVYMDGLSPISRWQTAILAVSR